MSIAAVCWMLGCTSEESSGVFLDAQAEAEQHEPEKWPLASESTAEYPYKPGTQTAQELGVVQVYADGCFSEEAIHFVRVSVPQTEQSLPLPLLAESILSLEANTPGRVVPAGEGLLPDRAWFYARLPAKKRPQRFAIDWFRSAGMDHPGEHLQIQVTVPDDCRPSKRLPRRFTESAVQYLRARANLGRDQFHPVFTAMATILADRAGLTRGMSAPLWLPESRDASCLQGGSDSTVSNPH